MSPSREPQKGSPATPPAVGSPHVRRRLLEAGKRRRLLLADDSTTIQKVVTLTFADEGMDVTTVGAGDEALRELEASGPPDIVLADVHMPGLTGYEVCERIKQDARWRHVPVILLAGAFEPFDEREARRVGADEVLSKPFQSIRDLIGKVGSLLGGKQPDDATREETEARAVDAGSDAPRARDERAAAASADAGDVPHAQPSVASPSFSDVSMDDELIEATPAEEFGSTAERQPTPLVSEIAGAFNEFEEMSGRGTSPRESESFAAAPPREAAVEAHAARPAFATHAASAALADDALLDLGGVDAPPSSPDADDFVLDIDLDEPPPAPRARRESAPPSSRPDFAAALAEAAHGVSADVKESHAAESHARDFIEPQVVPAGQGARPSEDLSVEGDVSRPPVEALAQESAPAQFESEGTPESSASVQTATSAAAAERGIDPQQLSPEVIDTIARRAVELMSERAVQEIAWEVVPALAERLIKERLDKQK